MTTPDPVVIDYSGSVQDAQESGIGLLQDNVLLLLALPVAWVGYRVVKKIIAKIG
jgi:hypothetical protein